MQEVRGIEKWKKDEPQRSHGSQPPQMVILHGPYFERFIGSHWDEKKTSKIWKMSSLKACSGVLTAALATFAELPFHSHLAVLSCCSHQAVQLPLRHLSISQ